MSLGRSSSAFLPLACLFGWTLSTALVAQAPTEAARLVPPPFDREAPLPPVSGLSKTLSKTLEIDMARRAAPEVVSRSATIWALGPSGYEVAQRGDNGWGCLVQRGYDGAGRFARCDDGEGVAALYPPMFLLEEYRAAGRSAADYERAVAEGYRTGRFRAPRRGAISYMYADHEIPPHVMVAMPNCRPGDLGFQDAEQLRHAKIGVGFLAMGQPDCFALIYTPEETRRRRADE